jgi:sugar (pentulose or hexulose) kinase
MLYLSLDVGTSATKASVLDADLRELATAQAEYPYLLLPGAKVEIDPAALLRGMAAAVRGLDERLLAEVECVCYDTFSPSPVFLDAAGDLAYPNVITHMDRRSAEQSAYIGQVIGNDACLEITGLYPFIGGSGLLSLLWLRQYAPECLARTATVTHLAGYLHQLLTGLPATDLVNASMLGVYETTTQSGWSKTLIDALGLNPGWFGEIFNPGSVHGTLRAEMADLFGVRAGIVVTIGTNDMAAAQVGAGNITPGGIMNTAGSSDMVSVLTDVASTAPDYYLRNSAFPGIWQIYATTAGGFAIDWFHDQFARDLGKDEFYERFLPAALAAYQADPGLGFAPYLTGDRQSLQVKTGAWTGLTLAATREQMLGAMLTAMARVLARTISQAAGLVRLNTVIKISGGLATEPLIALKQREIPGFQFQKVDNCSILGNVRLAQLVGKVV